MNTDIPIIVFGSGNSACLAAHGFVNDGNRKLAAFTVDAEYARSSQIDGRPLVSFDEVAKLFPPDKHEMLLPLGYTRMNAMRADRLAQAKAMGYTIANYVSRHALVSSGIGIGENVLIFEQALLQAYVEVGVNVTIRAGANIGHHTRIGDHTFVASGVVTGGNVTIEERCFIGLGAVLRDGIRIGARCFIGAGAVVNSDTEPDGVYAGNPARKLVKTSLEVTSG